MNLFELLELIHQPKKFSYLEDGLPVDVSG